MKTRNSSSAPKSSSPTPTPSLKKTKRNVAKTPTVSTSDLAPAPPIQRQSKRQAAIKANQAMLKHTVPFNSLPNDEVYDAQVMTQASSTSKTVVKKGTKRNRGIAKCKSPASKRMKSANDEDALDNNLVDDYADVEMAESVSQVKGKEDSGTDDIVQMDSDNKEDALPLMVTKDSIDKRLTEMDILAANNVGELCNARVKEEAEAETIETSNLLAENFGESNEDLKTKNCNEAETVSKLSENVEQKEIPKEGQDTINGKALTVGETITVTVCQKIDCQLSSTGEYTSVKNLDVDAKDKLVFPADTDGSIMEETDVEHDHDKLKEPEETTNNEVNEYPEELAVTVEETLDEMAVKDKQTAHLDEAICDSGERNPEVNDAGALSMDNYDADKDPEEVKMVKKEEQPGMDIDGMPRDGIKLEKDSSPVTDSKDVVECFKQIESSESKTVDLISDSGEKIDGLKVPENLERNTRNSCVDGEKLEEEHKEWTAVAKERRIKKEHEIIISELDEDMEEEDLRKVFEQIGEVVEVRLHKQSLFNKDKRYAFVRFADKDHVKRALIELKDPTIGGRSCNIGPNEDNDTLFLGNICNTWTKDAIEQKIKDYGVESVENITLVPDAQREGFSRGFAFLEFSCHDDALVAYQRLQKPDVIFGHAERTAKVAFAEPLRDPDPDVMLKVKTVFVDGLPPTCDEQYLREKVRSFGEIERLVLARNMTTAKRKDFGFVHFTTHEAAVACIDGINRNGLNDGSPQTKVKARLSNPLPKMQAVKGDMAGGFRIGFSGGPSKLGRGVTRNGHLYMQGKYPRGHGTDRHGYSQPDRMGYSSDYYHTAQLSRPVSGQAGSRGGFRPRPALPFNARPFIHHIRPQSVPSDASSTVHNGPVDPFHFDGGFGRHNNQRLFDDSHAYARGSHGTKRPFYITDFGAGYVEPGRRPPVSYVHPPNPVAASYSSHGAQGPLLNVPHNYYRPPANPRPHDNYRPRASAHPHDFHRPPSTRLHYYGHHSSTRPPEYDGLQTSGRPPVYYMPPTNIRPLGHLEPDYIRGVRPSAYRGNPPGGGFNC